MLNKKILIFLIIIILIGLGFGAFFLLQPELPEEEPGIIKPEDSKEDEKTDKSKYLVDSTIEINLDKIRKFSDEEEFVKYLSEAEDLMEDYYRFGPSRGDMAPDIVFESPEIVISAPLSPDTSKKITESLPERYSETNVQVQGIDEPDIVKTDGKNIYLSEESPYYWKASETNKTKIAQAFPLENLSLKSEIDKAGKLLLKNNILVIFTNDGILGYDISEPENPQKKWQIKIEEKTALTGARLQGEAIYLITAYSTGYRNYPCLIEPIIINDKPLNIDCLDVYYPGKIIPVDAIYTIIKLDLQSGEEKEKISFVGSRNNSIIYMSFDNLYLSYFQQINLLDFMTGFLKEKGRELIPDYVIESLDKLSQYEISLQAKTLEMEIIIQEYMDSLSKDEQLRIENELLNQMPDYYENNRRKLESTGIMKIGLDDFTIKAVGNVPGILLNQFAMDEYNGSLRIATTIGESLWWRLGLGGTEMESVNDVYVLNQNLEPTGSIKDLGKGERIYSVRFINDKGYVVTFREIDPFYVLDLADPLNPEMKGELKIPGYSSYLHPISKDQILGIGKEGANVKISLFDVSDLYQPREVDKYFLVEYWSEILNNHHAFLLDDKYEIFFLPGSKGGYVFSFKGNQIVLKKAISQARVKRALYIDDYFYLVSASNIMVFDQTDWQLIKELDL